MAALNAEAFVDGGALWIAFPHLRAAADPRANQLPVHVPAIAGPTVMALLQGLKRSPTAATAYMPTRLPSPATPMPGFSTMQLIGEMPAPALRAPSSLAPAPPARSATASPSPSPTMPFAPDAGAPVPSRRPTPSSMPGWIIDKALGKGASSDVLLAHREDGVVAALKRLRLGAVGADRDQEHERLLRFEREVSLIGRLAHSNVIRLYDKGQDESGPWMAVEFVDGGSVADLLMKTGPMPVPLAVRLVADVLAGLQAAHSLGVVHRDVKPENLLLTTDGVCKVADFGVAKASDSNLATAHGVTYGSPAYMSPEQAQGHDIDARSDLFSVGAILWELLSQRRPFERASVQGTLLAVCQDDPGELGAVVAGVPPRLDAVIRRLLHKDPAQRFARAQDVLEELQPLIDVIECQHAGVVGRALKDATTTVAALKDAHKNALLRQAEVALQRTPPGRHEAAYALAAALRLAPTDAIAKRRLAAVIEQHRVRVGAPDLEDLTRLSAAELRRAGLDAFDEGAVDKAVRRLRRYQRLHPQQANSDPIAIGRLTLIQGCLDAPFALRATTTTAAALVPARPPSTPPTVSVDRRRRSSRWPVAAALAIGLGVGIVASNGAVSVDSVGEGQVGHDAAVLYKNAVSAAEDGDLNTAALLFSDVLDRAGDSALGADAGLRLAAIVAERGDTRRAREVVARVLAMTRSTPEQRTTALKRLNDL